MRLWGRAEYETSSAGLRRAVGVVRVRGAKRQFRAPTFFKMSPHFDMSGVVVLDSLEPDSVHDYQIGYFFSNAELGGVGASTSLDWRAASRSSFRTGTDDPSASRTFVFGSCRYLLRLLGGAWFDLRGDKIFESILRQIDEGRVEIHGLLMVGDQIYADDLGAFFSDRLPDEYLKRYRDAFSQPGIRELMSRVPTYMTLDDHEIEDAWPKNASPSDFRVKYPASIHAYQVYQASHSPLFRVRGHRIEGIPEKLWYMFRDGCCDFFVMDVRTERVLGGPGEARLVSSEQMSALLSWLTDGSGRVKLVVSSVPLFPETRAKTDDHWAGFPRDRHALLSHIVEHRVERVVFLSGDIHASLSAELCGIEGTKTRLISVISSPFFWPYPEVSYRSLVLEGTLRSSNYVLQLQRVGPVHSTDNFTRITVDPDRITVSVFSRKGDPLAPDKVHYF